MPTIDTKVFRKMNHGRKGQNMGAKARRKPSAHILATPLGNLNTKGTSVVEKPIAPNSSFSPMDSLGRKRVLIFDEAHYQTYLCDKKTSQEV